MKKLILLLMIVSLLPLAGCASATKSEPGIANSEPSSGTLSKRQSKRQRRAQKLQLRAQKEQIQTQKIADEQLRLEKMKGWEYVRVEKRVPSKDCVYKLQLACGEKDAASCYTWYKQMAKVYDCNTVVMTEDVRSESSKGGFGFVAGLGGGGGYKTNQSIAALADFYVCPEYKPGEQK